MRDHIPNSDEKNLYQDLFCVFRQQQVSQILFADKSLRLNHQKLVGNLLAS